VTSHWLDKRLTLSPQNVPAPLLGRMQVSAWRREAEPVAAAGGPSWKREAEPVPVSSWKREAEPIAAPPGASWRREAEALPAPPWRRDADVAAPA
jgi:hypothetical protein